MPGQNKQKNDYRVRFQNMRFKKQLEAQRNYKRTKKILPQTDWGVFLSKVGLGSWWSRSLTLLVFLLLIYLVYIPNFLFIKKIRVFGLNNEQTVAAEKEISEFLTKKLPWPQKNLVLLSKKSLEDYLIKINPEILKVEKITKNFPNTLEVTVSPRIDTFAVETSDGIYTVSNDGKVTGLISSLALSSTTLPSNLILIKLTTTQSIFSGAKALSQNAINYVLKLKSQLPAIIKLDIDHFELADSPDTDLVVKYKNGFRLLFDLTSDSSKTLTRLQLLLSQVSESDQKKLEYIDMRFEDKGYLCFVNTACVKDINLPSQTASSTIEQLVP